MLLILVISVYAVSLVLKRILRTFVISTCLGLGFMRERERERERESIPTKHTINLVCSMINESTEQFMI